MGKIKKILENELVGGTQTTDVYPVTSTKAVYDENNERLDNIISKAQQQFSKLDSSLLETDYKVSDIFGGIYKKEYELKQGTEINTTSPDLIFKVNIPANTAFNLSVTTTEGTSSIITVVYKEDGSYESFIINNGVKAQITKAYKITGIGFEIQSPTENGTATVAVEFLSRIAEAEKSIDELRIEIYGSAYTQNYELKQGTEINTTSPHLIINTEIEANVEFEVTLAVTDQTKTAILFLKKENGEYVTLNVPTNQNTSINRSFKIIGVAFLIKSPTENGTATLTVKTKWGLKDETDNIPQIENRITAVENNIKQIESTINGRNYEREYNVTQGTGINTTSPNLKLITDIKENQYFTVLLSSTEETKECYLYLYKDSSNYVNEKVQLGREVLLSKDYKIIGIGFYIPSPTADGTVTLSVNTYSQINQIKKDVDTQKYYTQKLHLADAISAWANGEKFPIGWHGDSTTDGVSTTGWTTSNSHPAQDEAAGGRGKADYICTKAYPYILEQMLRSEFNNDNLRMYNIGYYGASLSNNYEQLEDIYSYVYSDVKMVGLSLSINDRVHYNTLSGFYRGVYDYLIKYVEFYRSKGIVPFMVLQQAVTQGGNNGSDVYNAMYQNYVQTLANKAKIEVAKLYGLEVIDMNSFGFTLLNASNYSHNDLSENLHFKDLGHKLEAEYLFSELVPWVEKTDGRNEIYLGILSRCAKSDIALTGSTTANPTSDKFKLELNFTKSDTSDKLIYEYYIFNNSGQYNLQYMTPEASGYIIHNGTRTEINSTVVDLGIVDIGLHKLQVYTGESNKVAFKGFKFVE